MEERIATTERLARALEGAKAPPQMIERARAGYYDDFKSDSAAPILRLVTDCLSNKLSDVALRAKNGEFDAQDWEGDEWAQSAEGHTTFAEFGHLFK